LPTHYALRSDDSDSSWYLKSWLIKTSVDGENWQEVSREEDRRELAGCLFTVTFPVAGCGKFRFIRLVNIGGNHRGRDVLRISTWEIFGSLIEEADSSSNMIPQMLLSPTHDSSPSSSSSDQFEDFSDFKYFEFNGFGFFE
jgi:hypothetical protein